MQWVLRLQKRKAAAGHAVEPGSIVLTPDTELTIGREANIVLLVDGKAVSTISRLHASLNVEGNQLTVTKRGRGSCTADFCRAFLLILIRAIQVG